MIHQPDYVKELIKKYIEGAMTGVEFERLKACWKVYDEDELLDMTAEILYTMGRQEPDDALESWEPDFTAIIRNAQKIQRNKKIWLCSKVSAVACMLVLLVMAVNHFIFEKWPGSNTTGGCGDMPFRSEMPRSEFACTIRWGGATALTIDSSSMGLVTQIGNFEIRQETSGLLVLAPLPGTTPVDTTRGKFVEVLTAARRQYIIQLPGSISIHLNAGSSIRLPFISAGHDTCYLQLSGEAYIEMRRKVSPQRLVVETFNSQLQTVNSNFTVSALPGYTKATLSSGSLVIFSRQGIHSKDLNCPGDQTVIKSYDKPHKTIADSLFFRRHSDVEEALVWTKSIRNYRNIPLRQFVLDMSRWCGFVVENFNCIPGQLRISTSICYRASQQEVYAEIRKAGIAVYERGNRISFCNPAKENNSSPGHGIAARAGKISIK